ncbi:hypothetical protein L2E82_12735 [Cichorium intybus]|uniref:Uncharacterized protein n=1 Tax=Cichorium intybus TaxID=13427 RepID=A0ACB9GIV2_CICIN|nr:hypothetical protein L2E82_12735 [Cichorium intybus]
MAQSLLLFLILIHTFLILAASAGIEPSGVEPLSVSPSNNKDVRTAEAPRSRKLGHHHARESEPPSTTASSSTHDEENGGSMTEESGMYLEKQHHHGSESVDKSIAGGGVILGGLVMAFVVSIVCYIRATRRRSMVEPPSPTTVRSNSSEEHSEDKQEEVAFYKEPSMYDNLSKTLGSATESIADAYKRRLLADDLFLTKVGIESGVGIFTKWHGLISHGVTLHFTNRHLKILRWHMYSSTVATMFTGFASTALFGHTLTINFILGISIVFISMHQLFSTLAKVKEEENGVLELKPVESNHMDTFVNIVAGANEEGSHRVESDERRPLLPSLIDNGALRVKNNVLRFSGFAWQENDEKQKMKVKEKLDKYNKENLLEFCDLLDMPISKTFAKKVMLYTVGPELQKLLQISRPQNPNGVEDADMASHVGTTRIETNGSQHPNGRSGGTMKVHCPNGVQSMILDQDSSKNSLVNGDALTKEESKSLVNGDKEKGSNADV